MDKALDATVRERAHGRCEYCHLPQSYSRIRFPIDHVIARQHDGLAESENLALACSRRNRHKGPNIAGLDPLTRQLVRLFHPRRDLWSEHLRWDALAIVGLTPIGRATVHVLAINSPGNLAVRQEMLADGVFPPT